MDVIASNFQKSQRSLPGSKQAGWKMPSFQTHLTILDLPHELILIVLESVESLSDLAALIKTAPSFNNVWKTRTASISAAILPTAIECYSQALMLEEDLHPEEPVGFEMVLQRHSRIVRAARCANEVWDLFLLDFATEYFTNSPEIIRRLHYRNHRHDFKLMLYWMWRVVGASAYKPFKLPADLCSNLHRLPRGHLLPLCEVTAWLGGKLSAQVKNTIAKMRNVYRPRDRVRYSYHDRWMVCCEELWNLDFFTKCHNDYFVRHLQVTPLRPPYGRMYHSYNFFGYRDQLQIARRSLCRLYY